MLCLVKVMIFFGRTMKALRKLNLASFYSNQSDSTIIKYIIIITHIPIHTHTLTYVYMFI